MNRHIFEVAHRVPYLSKKEIAEVPQNQSCVSGSLETYETDPSHRQADGPTEMGRKRRRRSQLVMRARLLCDALSDKQSDDVGGGREGRGRDSGWTREN